MRPRTLALMGPAFAVAACASQPAARAFDPPGFFSGIWHGLISPVALIAGIFSDARIYAFPNSGWFYDLGFMLGVIPALIAVALVMEAANSR